MGATSDVGGGSTAVVALPRAHLLGVKFCQLDTLNTGKSVEVSQPMKKSHRNRGSSKSRMQCLYLNSSLGALVWVERESNVMYMALRA
ncbi:hypothetical protein CJ030_MR3G029259 [Morella rubra]|uniref:Uncharacterized protein n=1 Tax=Morella rubra TaxID=262757 RepID=A0A6A1W6V6_9ROSI|nr:hypothetical protein CJ030_MR3G029259 [Morella rubra]